MIVGDLLEALDERYPFVGAGDWDPVGLQIGGASRPADRIGVCHEVTTGVVKSALDDGLDCLVSYHPLIFVPSTSLVDGSGAEGLALRLAETETSLVIVHTAMDVAIPGTSDALLAELGLTSEATFAPVDDVGGGDIGRIGRFAQPVAFDALVSLVSRAVSGSARASAAHPDFVETVAVGPGTGGAFASEAVDLADVYVSGDIGHHAAKEAAAMGLGIIDAGHVPTERAGVKAMYSAVIEASSGATMLDDDPHPWEG